MVAQLATGLGRQDLLSEVLVKPSLQTEQVSGWSMVLATCVLQPPMLGLQKSSSVVFWVLELQALHLTMPVTGKGMWVMQFLMTGTQMSWSEEAT